MHRLFLFVRSLWENSSQITSQTVVRSCLSLFISVVWNISNMYTHTHSLHTTQWLRSQTNKRTISRLRKRADVMKKIWAVHWLSLLWCVQKESCSGSAWSPMSNQRLSAPCDHHTVLWVHITLTGELRRLPAVRGFLILLEQSSSDILVYIWLSILCSWAMQATLNY